MKELRARRPSAGTILGALALMVALGGTAIGLPGKKTVDRNDLKRNVVKSPTVIDDALAAADIGPNAVGSSELANGQVKTADVVVCGGGTQLVNGLCWDSAATAQLSWANASDDCSDRGGRLPSVGELVAAKDTAGFDYGTSGSASNHYSDTIYDDDGTMEIAVVAEDATLEIGNAGDDQSYRCVFERIR